MNRSVFQYGGCTSFHFLVSDVRLTSDLKVGPLQMFVSCHPAKVGFTFVTAVVKLQRQPNCIVPQRRPSPPPPQHHPLTNSPPRRMKLNVCIPCYPYIIRTYVDFC